MPKFTEIPVGGAWHKWTATGEYVEGEVLALDVSSKYKDGCTVRMKTEDGVVAFSAPTVLEQTIRDNSLIGRTARFTFIGEKPVAGGSLKQFKVEVADAE